MTTLLIILVSVTLFYLIIRFIKYVGSLYLILCCLCILGIPLAFYNVEWGVALFIWGAASVTILFIVASVAGAISGIFVVLVVAPLVGIWLSIKTMLFRFNK